MRFPLSGLVGALLLCSFDASSHAKFLVPQLTPVNRLVANAEAYLARNAGEADAHYTLGRIHYLAFSIQRDQIPSLGHNPDKLAKPVVPPQWMRRGLDEQGAKTSTPFSQQSLIKHAGKAQQGFREALRLDAGNALYQLGLASLLEEFATWANAVKPGDLPAELRGISPTDVRDAYGKAFDLAMPEDSKLKDLPLGGIGDITAHEAASAYIRLSKQHAEGLTEADKQRLAEATTAVSHFKSLHMAMITPIVFSFQPTAHLEAMLAPETVVDFDLRGYGTKERWPWVKPDLGFVVWDPQQTGAIESARQLFGGYTFQIFRKNGYDALAALDDNGDGELTGAELDGLSVWFDRNSDGRSSADEVIPLRSLGVLSIATRASSFDGRHPTNAQGLTLSGGRVLPTWDWMVEPVETPY